MSDQARETTEHERGLYGKFHVERTDGRSAPGEKHDGCEYFVLDLDHDPLALSPLRVYADAAWEAGYHALAEDLWAKLRERGLVFETIPEAKHRHDETAAFVRRRCIELWGEDESKWPRVLPEGR